MFCLIFNFSIKMLRNVFISLLYLLKYYEYIKSKKLNLFLSHQTLLFFKESLVFFE